MSWFKVDDKLHDHRKARKVRRSHAEKKRDVAPFGLWTLAGSWAGGNRTGGFIPLEVLEEWDDDAETLAERLVQAGLWWHDELDGEPGYRFHDWADQNPAQGEEPGDYGRRGNHIRWHQKRGVTDPDCPFCSPDHRGDGRGDSGGESSRPVPTRPVPAAAAAGGDAAAAASLPTSLDILATKLRANTALQGLRFDGLAPARAAELERLITLHGDAVLVDVALRTCRTPPPVHVSAFIGTWLALPEPGQRLKLVDEPMCTVHDGQREPAARCRYCAADRLAGDA